MPRTEGSKNRPKTNTTKDYASQIAEKQESITSLTAEITAIQKAIEEQKNTLKERKSALKNIGVRHHESFRKRLYCKSRCRCRS